MFRPHGGVAVLDAVTSTSSHELCEANTDPIPGQGWYDDANGEIGAYLSARDAARSLADGLNS